jgi:translation initiation factor eIF-2B subunit beta
MDILQLKFDSFLRNARQEFTGSQPESLKLANLLQEYVARFSLDSFDDIQSLIRLISEVGHQLEKTLPLELSLGNIVRRTLHIIREECTHHGIKLSDQSIKRSLSAILSSKPACETAPIPMEQLRQSIMMQIKDLVEELENHRSNIAEYSIEHIHSNEVVLTLGYSTTVKEFLQEAKISRKFEVIVAEGAPYLDGHLMALELAKSGVSTTLIPDSSVYAIMSRVNKVIIGTHSIMANGGLVTVSGVYGVCLAALDFSVPVLVVCGLYKLCPLYPFDQDTYNMTISPSLIMERTEDELVSVSVPACDYIPPELVSLYVTNVGGHNPFYLYRLLSEYYSPEDYHLS